MKKDLYSYQRELVDYFINNNFTEQTIQNMINPSDRQLGVKLILKSDYYKARKRRLKLNKIINNIK